MSVSEPPPAAAAAPASPVDIDVDGPAPGFLRRHAETRGFMLGRPTHAQPTPDGKSVLFLRSTPDAPVVSLYQFDVASGVTRELLTPASLLQGAEEKLSPEERARRERMRVATRGFTDFELSTDGARLLVSLSGRLYLLDRARGAASELPTGEAPVLDPRLSPDGTRVAFVRGRDLHVLDLASRKETRLTESHDEKVTNGLAEFVAQEELSRFAGYWFSPDGSAIAFEEADNRPVETLHIADPTHPDRAPESFSYPRPGKENARVRLGVVPTGAGATPRPTWIAWDAARFPYLASVTWPKRGLLTLVVMTREQQDLEVLAADPSTGATRRLLAEHDDAWLDLDPSTPRWLADGSGFLWSADRPGASEKDAMRRLELRDASGAFVRTLSPEGAAFIRLLHVDARRREAYFLATAEPTEQHLYRARLDDGHAVRLTREPGLHAASFGAPEGKAPLVYALTRSTLDRMPVSTVHVVDGDTVREAGTLPSVAAEPPFAPRVEMAEAGPERLRAVVVRPRRFDPTRKYPVWLDVYGGPHHQQVQKSEAQNLFRQWIADHGYVVVAVDGRGTPLRGRRFERAIRGDFGTFALEDQVSALRALAAKHPEIDATRAGVVGWSFGGYLAALATMRRPDVFRVGVAGAPVVDWRDYDTAYTERYLGLPDAHRDAYEKSSLLTFAASLARPLLLIHGTADDNVYFFHSLKLADALLRAGKPFELLPLAGFTHMVPDPVMREQMWSRILATMAAALKP